MKLFFAKNQRPGVPAGPLFLFLFGLYFLFLPAMLWPAESAEWVVAEGFGTIVDNETGKARDDAMNDAKRAAVRKSLGSVVRAKSSSQSGVFESSEIEERAEGFIEAYTLLESGPVSKTEYRVLIRARVSKTRMEQALDELLSAQSRPLMVVLIDEKLFGQSAGFRSLAGTALEAEFTRKGFSLADSQTLASLRASQPEQFKLAFSGNSQAASRLATLAGAEIIVLGECMVSSAGPVMEGSPLNSVQADLRVTVIEKNTGMILAAGQEHAAYPHVNLQSGAKEATARAAARLAAKISEELAQKWKTGKANVIELVISGASYEQVKKLRSELLEKIRGVRAVHRKESSGELSFLQVEFEGDAFTLADRLSEANWSFPLVLGKVKRNYVELKLQP